jgi:photosystem II stability/assembly factor-like uncharacterized protein
VTPSECAGVRDYESGSGNTFAFSETWNGTSWSVVPSPAPAGALSSGLADVSCTSADSCSAVGSYVNSAGQTLTLAATWNGSVWTKVKSPNPSGATGSELFGVACGDPTTCVAVGDSFTATGNHHTLESVDPDPVRVSFPRLVA